MACNCDDCQTYFNDNVERPIIEVSQEDLLIIERFLSKVELKNYCDKHTGKPIICKYCYCEYWDSKEGTKQIEICYRYPNCKIKAFIILLDDKRFVENAWGSC